MMIQSPLPRPVASEPGFGRDASAAAPQASDFAALVASVAGADASGQASPLSAGASGDRAGLASAVAHLFNEYGFFPVAAAVAAGGASAAADPPGPQAPAPALPHRLAAQSGAAEAAMPASRPVAGTPMSRGRGRLGDRCPPLPGGSHAGAPAPLSARADAGSGMALAEPGAAAAGEGSRVQFVRGVSEPAAERPAAALPASVAAKAADPERDVPGIDPVRAGPRTPVRNFAHSPGDRLVIRVDEQIVELVGRLRGLGDDERKRLIDALSELLEAHGLALGSARLNGKPVEAALSRGRR